MTITKTNVSLIDIQSLKEEIGKKQHDNEALFNTLKQNYRDKDIISGRCSNCGTEFNFSYKDCHSGNLMGYEVNCPICYHAINVRDPLRSLCDYVKNLAEYKKAEHEYSDLNNRLERIYADGRKGL